MHMTSISASGHLLLCFVLLQGSLPGPVHFLTSCCKLLCNQFWALQFSILLSTPSRSSPGMRHKCKAWARDCPSVAMAVFCVASHLQVLAFLGPASEVNLFCFA